ncbi:unnamed protein product, partial [Rotaria magnacalcarata]
MNKSDDNERLEEEELSSVGQEKTNNQTVQQSNDDESKLQHDLANELKHTLKIPITDELPNIG